MGLMKRRAFLFGGLLASTSPGLQATPDVRVMEVFSSANGPSALLVHHADEATRDAFANWLRNNSGRQVTCELRESTRFAGRIFRMRLCFGRGLILFSRPVNGVQPNDILRLR